MGRHRQELGDLMIRQTLQRIKNQIPDNPHAALLFGIFEQAVEDYFYPSYTCIELEQRRAAAFLTRRLDYVGLLGLDVDWVREEIARLIERHRRYGDKRLKKRHGDYHIAAPPRAAEAG